MTKWPTGNIPTTSVDSQADRPDRRVFKTLFDKFNQMMGARNAANGVAGLDADRHLYGDQMRRGESGGVAPLEGTPPRVPVANLPDQAAVPVGGIMVWPGYGVGPTVSWSWAICDGRWLRKADYPVLFRLLQNRYLAGATARSADFRIPDLQNRMVIGAGAAHPIANRGGAGSATLTAAHMPEHRHLLAGGSYSGVTGHATGQNQLAVSSTTHGDNDAYVLRGRSGEPTVARSGKAGAASPTPVPTMPPWYSLYWLMRTR